MKRAIYLSGPMDSCNDFEMTGWREQAKAVLGDKYIFNDPVTGAGVFGGVVNENKPSMNKHTADEIVQIDKADIDKSDILLCYVWKPSHGTSMEIIYGWEQGKTIISVAPKVLSPWVQHHSHFVFRNLEDAYMQLAECGVPVQERYSLGFMFDGDDVILIRKDRPEFQRGLLNGIGGKVVSGETSLECMVREFKEESGYATHSSEWKHFGRMHRRWGMASKSPYSLDMFVAKSRPGALFRSTTSEMVTRVPWREVYRYSTIPNLPWLVSMARAALAGGEPFYHLAHD